jgi:hypothetical protein
MWIRRSKQSSVLLLSAIFASTPVVEWGDGADSGRFQDLSKPQLIGPASILHRRGKKEGILASICGIIRQKRPKKGQNRPVTVTLQLTMCFCMVFINCDLR